MSGEYILIKKRVYDRRDVIAGLAAGVAGSMTVPGSALAAAGQSDNSHAADWQWLVGNWDVHHRRLQRRLANDTHWDEFGGRSAVWLTMGGLGTIDDNIMELPAGTYRATGIRAFDPQSGRWLIWWLDERNPTRIDPPVLGGFQGTSGLFYGDDVFDGRPIRVRFRWQDTHGPRPNWEQAFSPDGGQNWEVNWTNAFTRRSTEPSPLPLVPTRRDDWDFLVGRWAVQHRRLRKRFVTRQEWDVFDGTLVNWPVLGGNGNVGDNVMNFPDRTVRGVGIRAFDASSQSWSSWWLDARTPTEIGAPLRGSFALGVGTFLSEDTIKGEQIKNRVIWSHITRDSARWEQAASRNGSPWEVNWTSDFRRLA